MAMVSEGFADVNTTCSPVRHTDHFVERFEDHTCKCGTILVLAKLRLPLETYNILFSPAVDEQVRLKGEPLLLGIALCCMITDLVQ
jgi:hypothetical protein